ncbi:Flagellar motility protein MotE, a chaperone for MotC folding [Devosia enhydra]|uniref:Flagellar motility protein MotE, a chaperone for MotC folding n=1 Tax=Devosia enhydra TaxID=665118 RepID=A0A1K2HTW3_9HYPH|nr:MotE family protein [Devosia enhydra]SFZ81523.1 Flagellar motility protein MotE, a chaperone for MotC folding [Devosia enhydra]
MTPRLIPIVIFAAGALLGLKSIGLVSQGGYVLSGVGQVQASGGGSAAPPAGTDAAMPSIDTPALASTPTLTDTAPTVSDGAPTLSLGGEGGDGHGSSNATEEHLPDIAAPMTMDGAGREIPLAPESGRLGAEEALAARLAERRAELDALARELEARLALVEAAEKRIDDRAAALAGVEARIAALVDERKAMEDAQFAAVVSMYETMKPRDAAGILNALQIDVVVRIARAMNARKMAPILAAMDPGKAQELTGRLAAPEVITTQTPVPGSIAALPQIVGQ